MKFKLTGEFDCIQIKGGAKEKARIKRFLNMNAIIALNWNVNECHICKPNSCFTEIAFRFKGIKNAVDFVAESGEWVCFDIHGNYLVLKNEVYLRMRNEKETA